MAWGTDQKCRVVWTDTRAGGTEIFFTMLDEWGNRLLPDIQVSHSPAVSSTVPRVDVDAAGFAYVCWLEAKTVWLAKLDVSGNTVDSTAVNLGFNYLAEYPDLDVTPSSGLGVGFTSQSGVLDEDYQVLFDPDLNKICQRRMFTNLTWLDRHVTERCDDDLHCTMYWQSTDVFAGQNLSGGAITPTCGDFGSGNICSGNNYSTMSNHAPGLVVQRGTRIYLGSGGGCPTAFSELPGPSVAPTARQLDGTRSIVAWQDGRNGTNDIYFAVYNNSNRVKTGVDSSFAAGASSSAVPSVTTNLDGIAMVAWQDDRDGNNEIYFARTPEPSASCGTLTGTVFDAVTLQPIPYAHVLIQGPERPLQPARDIIAGGDGHYRAAGLPAGAHSLMATGLGHVSPRQDGITLAAGQSRVVDLYVSTGVVLSGTVRDVDSRRPIRGVRISLQSNSGPPFLRTTTSDLDGRYRFDVAAGGSFAMGVRDPVPGVSTDYFSVANDYYVRDTVLSLMVPGDVTKHFDLACNTVVLLHGIFATGDAFGKAANVASNDSLLRARLEHAGYHTEAPTRNWRQGIPEQGTAVAQWFADRPFTSARVIAHSMGGLAARWYIEEIGAPGPGRSMPLLVTLGTPHHGSPVAGDVHTLLIAFGALSEALNAIPFVGGPSFGEWESQVRGLWHCLTDLQPNNANLNQLNYGDRDYSDSPLRFLCGSSGGPAHDSELLSSGTVYVALAGEGLTPAYLPLTAPLGAACASDGVVPVHSARLWNSAATNLRTRCLTNAGTGTDCSAAHRPQFGKSQTPELNALFTAKYVESHCVAVQLVNILRGAVPIENCSIPQDAESVSDSLYDALPETDQALGARDSLASSFTIAAGQSLIVWTRWQRGGVRVRLSGPAGVVVDSAACVGNPTRDFSSDPALHWSRLVLTAPAAGTWTLHASTDADSAQRVNVRVFVTGDVTIDASVRSTSWAPGGAVRVEGHLSRSGAPLTGATLLARWTGPGSTTATFGLHDDGAAPDDTPADGVYTGAMTPAGVGPYALELVASGGSGPDYGARAARTAFSVGLAPDIRLGYGDISAAANWAYPADVLPLQVHVHNLGSSAADSVWFGVRDDSTGVIVKDTLLAVPGGGEVLIPVAFSSSRRGVHHLSMWAVASGDPPDSNPTNNGALFGVEVVEFGQMPQIVAVPETPAPPSGPALISRVVPSPSHDAARIEFLLPAATSSARLTLFDVAGRALARLESGSLQAGWQSIRWDLRAGGSRVRAGIYFYRIECGAAAGSGTLVVR